MDFIEEGAGELNERNEGLANIMRKKRCARGCKRKQLKALYNRSGMAVPRRPDRIVQIAFESTRERFSTDKSLIPYILEGEVRAYNQEMLERTQVRSHALFYCVEDSLKAWR